MSVGCKNLDEKELTLSRLWQDEMILGFGALLMVTYALDYCNPLYLELPF